MIELKDCKHASIVRYEANECRVYKLLPTKNGQYLNCVVLQQCFHDGTVWCNASEGSTKLIHWSNLCELIAEE